MVDYVGKLHVHLARGRGLKPPSGQPAQAQVDLRLSSDAAMPPPSDSALNANSAISSEGSPASDLAGAVFHTRPLAQRDANPIWNQAFTFSVSRPFSVLEIVVRDRSTSAGSVLGRIRIPLSDLADQRQVTRWFAVRPRPRRFAGSNVGFSGNSGSSSVGLIAGADSNGVEGLQRGGSLLGSNDRTGSINSGDETDAGELSLTLHYKYLASWNTLYKGILCFESKQYAQAIGLLGECTGKWPNEAMLFGVRSEALARQGQHKAAAEDAQTVVELVPNSGEGYYRQGLVAFFREAYQEAEKLYRQALKYDSWHEGASQALANLRRESIQQQVRKSIAKGRTAFEKEEYELAAEHFNDAISSNPRNARYFVFRALTRLAAKEYDAAKADAMKVIELFPQWPKKDAEKEGYLFKEGQVNIMKQKRWFILKNHFLFYYDTRQDLQPNGVILLDLTFDTQLSKDRYLRIVTRKRTWALKAENQDQRDDWINILEKYMNRKHIQLPEPAEEEEDAVFVDVDDDAALPRSTPAEPVAAVHTSHNAFVSGPVAALAKVGGKLSKLMVHPITLENVSMEGSLFKLGALNKTWKRRYFILKQHTLYYFSATEEDVRRNTPTQLVPTGSIDVSNVRVSRTSALGKEFAFEITTSQRPFMLSALSQDDLDAWLSALRIASGDENPAAQNKLASGAPGHAIASGGIGGAVNAHKPLESPVGMPAPLRPQSTVAAPDPTSPSPFRTLTTATQLGDGSPHRSFRDDDMLSTDRDSFRDGGPSPHGSFRDGGPSPHGSFRDGGPSPHGSFKELPLPASINTSADEIQDLSAAPRRSRRGFRGSAALSDDEARYFSKFGLNSPTNDGYSTDGSVYSPYNTDDEEAIGLISSTHTTKRHEEEKQRGCCCTII